MDKALAEAIGRILKERFAAVEALVATAKITAIASPEPGVALLTFGDGSTQRLEFAAAPGQPGERGERGERGEPGERGERGHSSMGTQGERGVPGERGADGVGVEGVEQDEENASAFTLRFTNGDTVDVQLPQGPPGDPGAAGQPGVDRFIAAPRAVAPGELVRRNDLIAWGGGLVQALRDTTRTPADDPASFSCVVAGVESIALVENIETRTYDLTARLTNGLEQVCRLRAMPRLMGDGPRPGEKIIKGDQFVKGDWLYTATADGADAANTDAGGWRRQFIRGKRGEDGPRGPQGVPGVGIADVQLDESGILTVQLTTGEEKVFDARARAAA